VPAKEFAKSQAFYLALGFEMTLDGEVAIFSAGEAGGFILQNFYVPEWAGNFMMQLMVADLGAWWARIAALTLPERFGVAPPKPPEMQPWGLHVAYLVDPSGVLWHVAEAKPGARHDMP
jgi:uncharacterized glyoxalase superfamily protein PhnB